MEDGPASGGEPQTFGRCTACGTVYAVQRTKEGNIRPVGTDGSCGCGNEQFEPLFEP